MVYIGTYVRCVDNSGVRLVKCINFGGGKKKGSLGCLVIGVAKVVKKGNSLQGNIVKGILVRVGGTLVRRDGLEIRMSGSGIVLVGEKNRLKGTRVIGVVFRELKYMGFFRLLSLSDNTI